MEEQFILVAVKHKRSIKKVLRGQGGYITL